MKKIKEFLLDNKSLSTQTLYLPAGAKVLNVYDTEKGLILLTLVPPEEVSIEPPELRIFKICTTDEKFYIDTVEYIGSYKSSIGMRHVFEIFKGSY